MKKIYLLVLILFMANHLVGQNCQIVFTSPDSHNFSANGGTIDINVQYSTTQCEQGVSNRPSWISSATFLNRNTLRLVASSNSGPARSGTVTITVNSGSTSNISVSQATNAVPPGTPTVTGDNRCGAGSVTLTASPGSGGNAIRWYTSSTGGSPIGTSTSLTRTVNNTTTYYAASYNTSTQLYSSRVAAVAQVTSPPTPLLGSAPSGCSGASVTGSAQSLNSDNVSSHVWYTAASGGSVVSGVAQNTAPDSGYYISSLTRTITATTTYYVASVCNGLESSSRRAVTFTLDNAPQITIGVSGGAQTSYCPGETVTLLGQGGSNYQWRRGSATGTVLSTSTSFGVTASDTYYVTGTRSCGSTQTRSIVISFQAPATPTPPTITNNCGNTVLTKTSAPTGFTYYWQGTASGTATSSAAAAQSITRTSGSVYYLRARNNSTECWGPARTVNYSIDAVPNTPTNATGDSRCGTGSITVSATPGSGGNTIRWYTASSGGSVLATGLSLTRTVNQTTTYYAETYNGTTQCTSSSRLAVQASVGAPAAPQEVSNSGCSGESGPISARSIAPDVTEHRWYNNASGGSAISGIAQDTAPGSGSYISTLTKTFTQTETYYVAAVCNGQESSTRTAVTYTVTSAPNITIGVSGGAQPQYCASSVTLLAQGGSNYQWRQGSETGSIIGSGTTLEVTTSDTYFLTGTRACGASQNRSIEIVFANLSTPSIQSIVENCGSTIITMDNVPDGEVWHWQSTADGTNQSGSVEQIRTFIADEPLFLRSRAEFTDCWGPAIEVNLQVKLVPNAPAANDYTQCGNDPYDLFATMDPNADTIYWYNAPSGGTPLDEGTFYRVNTVVNGTTSYYVESYNSATGCTSATRTEIQATVLAGETPTAPTGQTVYFCEEGPVTLTVTQPLNADEIRWYDVQTGEGTILGTGTTFTTPSINETTTYYVEGVNTTYGCTSNFRRAIFAVRSQEIVWYLDEDQDGQGDPANPSVPSCTRPQGYVGNSNDICPEIYSPSNTCSSDPLDQNYIYTRAYQEQHTNTIDEEFFTENDNLIQDITYFDGLGRPLQQIAIDQSPQKNDIVTLMEYDGLGRMNREWLPYPTTDGNLATLRLSPKSGTLGYYNQPKYEDTQNPYSEKAFEIAPLNRVKQQGAPGNDWALGQGHEIELAYLTNVTSDNVSLFDATTNLVENNGVLTHETTFNENGTYLEGELYKNITYDENHTTGKNHSTEEFTNKEGQVILKRTYAAVGGQTEVAHDTYYVYDDFGNLSYVLPPKVAISDGVSPTELSELCYQYTYDQRNRLVEKQIPGKGKESIVYNKLDQPIMTQDANLQAKGQWLFTKYDAFGRVAYTGIIYVQSSRESLQANANANAIQFENAQATASILDGEAVYYSNDAFPSNSLNNANSALHTVNYYDNYQNIPAGAPSTISILGSSPTQNNTTDVQGLATASRSRVLDVTPAQWINTIIYYDDKARPVYTYSENEYLNTIDIISSQLDFLGRPIKVRTEHIKNGNSIVTINNSTYDHVGRLLTQTQCIGDETLGNNCSSGAGAALADLVIENETITSNRIATNSITTKPVTTISGTATLGVDPNATGSGNREELIVSNTYDELGQLTSKNVGGAVDAGGLQTVDYTYNVRGWLTGINDADDTDLTLTTGPNKLFAYRIGYNEGANALYNGNIAITQWQTLNDDASLKQYTYTYDALNRITNAIEGNNDRYGISNIMYDKNGNLLTLKRQGHNVEFPNSTNSNHFDTMDDLDYNYSGNQLLSVTDAAGNFGFNDGNKSGDDYSYDDNGNLISDANKGIATVTYNHLNLPTNISIIGTESGTIDYVYDATGVKLKKIISTGEITEYSGNYIYSGSQSNVNLKFFNHPEGYTNPNDSGGYDYIYQYKDHVGNIRLSYSEDPNNVGLPIIIEENNYYPFGLRHKGYNNIVSSIVNSIAQKFKFNGQEFEEALALNLYEMPLRSYDPAIARWTTIDPVIHYSNSTYNGYENNPVFWADPSGAAVEQIAGGTSYTGIDAQNMFRQLRNQTAGKEVKDWYLNIRTGKLSQTRNKYSFWLGNDQLSSDEILSELDNLGIDACFCKGKNGLKQIHADTEEIYKEFRKVLVAENLALTQNLIKEYGIVFIGNIIFPAGRVSIRSPRTFNPKLPISGGGVSSFSNASSYGIKSYKDLVKLIKGKGLEAHHLIEKRFASLLGKTPGSMESIALTKVEHQVFTNAWRARIGYNGSNAAVTTSTATRAQVESAARQIYKNYPEILKVLGL